MPPISAYKIVSTAGSWIVVSPQGERVGDLDFRNPTLAAQWVIDRAKDQGKVAKMISDAKGWPTQVQVDEAPSPRKSGAVRISFRVSPDTVAFLDKLGMDRGEDWEDVLRNALGLLRIAQDAKAAGNGIAIVTPEMGIEQPITGI